MRVHPAVLCCACGVLNHVAVQLSTAAELASAVPQMQACGEPPPEIVEDMSSAIAADLPGLGVGGEGGAGAVPPGGFSGLGEDLDIPPELLADLPKDLKNCPMQ